MKCEVAKYYDEIAESEWERLDTPYSKIEFESTMFLIDKYFPKKGKILDIGSGPGRYALELARKGYQMTLLDISENELDIAREKFRQNGYISDGFHCKSALELDHFKDEEFDSVLIFGPMYHLHDEKDRLEVLSGVKRILKQDGIALIAYINTWGALKASVYEFPESFKNADVFHNYMNGDLKFSSEEAFTTAYFTTAEHALKEVKKSQMEIISYAGAESFISGMFLEIQKLKETSEELYDNYIRKAAEFCEAPQYRDATEHLTIVVKK